jgi:hypothetical protein
LTVIGVSDYVRKKSGLEIPSLSIFSGCYHTTKPCAYCQDDAPPPSAVMFFLLGFQRLCFSIVGFAAKFQQFGRASYYSTVDLCKIHGFCAEGGGGQEAELGAVPKPTTASANSSRFEPVEKGGGPNEGG